ncbi:BgTH12-06535 [Blumeria graminis f. sp. triticale]|nr:BgTH12-06535 [Blumeria graminis f. sp. triticale]
MKSLLKEIYSSECKPLNILASLESLEHHAIAGTFPPQILESFKTPKFQFSTTFTNSGDHQASLVGLENTVSECRGSVLARFIEMKKMGLETYATMLTIRAFRQKIEATVKTTFDTLNFQGVEPCPEYLIKDREDTFTNGPSICQRATIIARGDCMAENARKKRKLQHKVDSDVTMTESGPSDITKTIRDEMEKMFKK